MDQWIVLLIIVLVVILVVGMAVGLYKLQNKISPPVTLPVIHKDYSYVEFQDLKNPWPEVIERSEKHRKRRRS